MKMTLYIWSNLKFIHYCPIQHNGIISLDCCYVKATCFTHVLQADWINWPNKTYEIWYNQNYDPYNNHSRLIIENLIAQIFGAWKYPICCWELHHAYDRSRSQLQDNASHRKSDHWIWAGRYHQSIRHTSFLIFEAGKQAPHLLWRHPGALIGEGHSPLIHGCRKNTIKYNSPIHTMQRYQTLKRLLWS